MRVKDLVAPEAEDISTGSEGLLLARRLREAEKTFRSLWITCELHTMGDGWRDPGLLGLGDSIEVS